jgi:2-methylcitrate dehydratase PrpD
VDVSVDESIEREWGRNISPSDMHVEMVDGATHRQRVDWPLGHPRRPMSAQDFDAKAVDCFRASPVRLPEDSPRQLRNAVDALESSHDVRSLLRILEIAS